MTRDEIAKLIPDNVVRAMSQTILYSSATLDDELLRTSLAAGLAAWEGKQFGGVQLGFEEQKWLTLPLKEPEA